MWFVDYHHITVCSRLFPLFQNITKADFIICYMKEQCIMYIRNINNYLNVSWGTFFYTKVKEVIFKFLPIYQTETTCVWTMHTVLILFSLNFFICFESLDMLSMNFSSLYTCISDFSQKSLNSLRAFLAKLIWHEL